MLFNSFRYILLFLPCVVLIAALARRISGWRGAQAVVLAASLFFYGYARPSNLPYLLGSILVNWLFGRWLATAPPVRRRPLLQLGLALNIGFLCLFKYINFFARSVPWLSHRGLVLPDLEFPLGISFFTITQIMYLVNCYEGAIKPSSLFDHATFVSFFPYVISGPISRAKRILHQFPQLGGRPQLRDPDFARGMYLFAMGLFKKVVFADAFSQAASFGFTSAQNLSVVEAWFFATCYALQIYFDFSGYSDMAIGSALMLDIQLPPNFDAPFQATSIIEYWQRWHISLTAFITSYLFTPIVRAFAKRTWVVTSFATIVAMTIAGLWHGPNWTFLVYGTIHGVGLTINQNWRTWKMPTPPDWVGWLLMMIVVDVSFVFFQAPSLTAALAYLPHMFDVRHLAGFSNMRVMNGAGVRVILSSALQCAGFLVAFIGTSSEARARVFAPTVRNAMATVALTLCAWVFLNSNVAKPFIYFAF